MRSKGDKSFTALHVEIEGTNFGYDAKRIRAGLGDYECPSPTLASSTRIVCPMPRHDRKGFNASAFAAGVRAKRAWVTVAELRSPNPLTPDHDDAPSFSIYMHVISPYASP